MFFILVESLYIGNNTVVEILEFTVAYVMEKMGVSLLLPLQR